MNGAVAKGARANACERRVRLIKTWQIARFLYLHGEKGHREKVSKVRGGLPFWLVRLMFFGKDASEKGLRCDGKSRTHARSDASRAGNPTGGTRDATRFGETPIYLRGPVTVNVINCSYIRQFYGPFASKQPGYGYVLLALISRDNSKQNTVVFSQKHIGTSQTKLPTKSLRATRCKQK